MTAGVDTLTAAQVIHRAWYGAQQLRPYRAKPDVLQAITPPGGEWRAEAAAGAITRSVMWGRINVAVINASGSLDDVTEGHIAMGIRATPVLDTALRTILKLARDGASHELIADIAESAVAYIEMPAPICRPVDDEEEAGEPEPTEDEPDPDDARDQAWARLIAETNTTDDEEPF